MTRRRLLSLSTAGILRIPALPAAEPRNLSYPLRMVEKSLTSPDYLFLRSHFSEPEVALEDWQLSVEGSVERPQTLSFADLLELPSTQLEVVLECAGNTANGSAISNARWHGVPLANLLQSAAPKANAKFVMLEGADQGRLLQGSPSLPYAQLVPVEKCLQADSLIAYKINDRFLPRGNGFPARALFPGWYAMDSVKWLRRIIVLNDAAEADTFFQSGMDRIYSRKLLTASGELQVRRLTTLQVKSAIAWPPEGAKLPAGKHQVWGFAWTGRGAVTSVAISTDAGATWSEAALESQTAPLAWRRWNFSWTAPPGDATLLSRASDDQGNQQPLTRDRARKDSYELNYCLPVRCSVR